MTKLEEISLKEGMEKYYSTDSRDGKIIYDNMLNRLERGQYEDPDVIHDRRLFYRLGLVILLLFAVVTIVFVADLLLK
jgi:hypothetical protein